MEIGKRHFIVYKGCTTMILYHAVTAYQVLRFIIHKLSRFNEEEAVLLVPEFYLRKTTGFSDKGIFSKVYFYTWEKSDSKEMAFSEIENQLESVIGPKWLTDISDFYVTRAEFYFGIYLVEHEMQFHWFEEADGRYSNPFPVMNDDLRLFPYRYHIANGHKLYMANNSCIKRKYIKCSAQMGGDYKDPLIEDYDVIHEMLLLSCEDKEKLLSFFDAPLSLDVSDDSAIMLTQNFCCVKQASYIEHKQIYQLTADYYLRHKTVYYKRHPSDLMSYESFLKDAKILDGQYPAELLTLLIRKKFDIGAAIFSTGIYNISSLYNRILLFNPDYLRTYRYNHEYYFLTKMIDMFDDYDIITKGVNDAQLVNMLCFADKGNQVSSYAGLLHKNCVETDKAKLIIIGDGCEKSTEIADYYDCDDENILVCIGENIAKALSPNLNYEECVEKKIVIKKEPELKFFGVLEARNIYIFTKTMESRSKIREISYELCLENSGISVVVYRNE